MHPAIIVCILLAIIALVYAIIRGIIQRDIVDFLIIFLIYDILIVGVIGFGAICGAIIKYETYEKISPDKVETFIFKDNGIVASSYEGHLYEFTEIEYLNSVNDIDYYALVRKFNAYHIETTKLLYPVKKGKIDDYIKEK